MKMNKKILCVLIISLILFIIQTQAAKITIPLRQYDSGDLYINTSYGTQDCEIDLFIEFTQECYNIISNPLHQTDVCGAKYIGIENYYTKKPNYSTQFQLGNAQATLQFIVSNEFSDIGRRTLCFSSQSNHQDNAFVQLFEEKLISKQVAYINLNRTTQDKADDSVVGTIDIGEPDLSLIKQGSNLVELQKYTVQDLGNYSSNCKKATYSGQNLDLYSFTHINFNSPFTVLHNKAFNKILQTFNQNGIKYRIDQPSQYKSPSIYLPSVEKLEPLQFQFQTVEGNDFTITLQAYQLYQQLPSGEYQLLIQSQLPSQNYQSIGSTVFQDYYIGVDFQKQSILIAEKASSQKLSNFRGTKNLQ
ncbi:transmembrane protein, putative (macronuclear) [Tetrahymena thermophila SB210]|uniref:Transmembrane protein, putative n=1 Tax=Tetrahymena thermophila (strain SB210) TaxID=312017 RepID=Q22UY7_TETTS|nr:transmembrane protein, putative [Tetrahymena thermophila SB210]EAR89161.1 transmembrane protein, putative [Tetrahymena thermophila SB210]|eukprot:XP_001009406.1 transmembrane protein, putative [Tetrahymena thermophila SB210]